MRALIHVRERVDDVDLWPYSGQVEVLATETLLSVEVADGRELVGVLVSLSERGLTVVRVESFETSVDHPDGDGGHAP